MNRRCWASLLSLILLPAFLFAENVLQPQGWVNDFANVISTEYRDKMTGLIQKLEERTSAELAVVTVESITPYDEKGYARLLFDSWKPGKKGKDNGVLVLLAVKDRAWRIETGYGVEGILPDGLCGEIGRKYMVPYFKEGKYGEGLYQGVLKIYEIISGEAITKERLLSYEQIGAIIFLLLVLIFVGIILFSSMGDRNDSYYGGSYRHGYYGGTYHSGGWGGGGFGGFGGGMGGGGGAGGKF